MTLFFVLHLLLLRLSPRPSSSCPEPAPRPYGRPTLLTSRAFFELRSISDLQILPDGNRLAFVVYRSPRGERRAAPHKDLREASSSIPAVYLP